MAMPVHCPESVASTRSRMETPPISIFALSPPPMRRARPPARIRPKVAGTGTSLIMHGGLAAVLGAFFLDERQILIEHDAMLARERDETLAARAPDQGQVRLTCELD